MRPADILFLASPHLQWLLSLLGVPGLVASASIFTQPSSLRLISLCLTLTKTSVIQDDLSSKSFSYSHLQRPFCPVRPHSQALRITTRHSFWEVVIQPITSHKDNLSPFSHPMSCKEQEESPKLTKSPPSSGPTCT